MNKENHFHQAVEIFALGFFIYYVSSLFVSLGRAWPSQPWALTLFFLFIVALVAYLAADATSGFIHFLADTFGSSQTPLLGKTYIQPFREHHINPKAITKHGFLEVNGNNCLVSLLLLIPTYYFLPISSSVGYFFLGSFVVFFVLCIFFTNQIHKWAHSDLVPRPVAWLQQHNIILSPKRHDLHHTAPFASYFCITNGWLNPLIERTGIFRLIERLVRMFSKKFDNQND